MEDIDAASQRRTDTHDTPEPNAEHKNEIKLFRLLATIVFAVTECRQAIGTNSQQNICADARLLYRLSLDAKLRSMNGLCIAETILYEFILFFIRLL